jgi:Holliday junction resolvase RusA-like endonuclease
MPSKKELKQYEEKYGEVTNDCLERIYNFIDGISDKQLDNVRKDIENNLNTKWKSISFIFYFIPKATPRARYTGFGKHFYVSDAMNNRKLMEDFVKNELSDFNLITTACKFYCDCYFPTPKSMTKSEQLRAEMKLINNLSKPDWDNLGKTYSDMIQNTIIMDDSLIIDGRVRKYYSSKPRIELTIEYADRYDSNYNMKNITRRKQYLDNIDKIDKDITF